VVNFSATSDIVKLGFLTTKRTKKKDTEVTEQIKKKQKMKTILILILFSTILFSCEETDIVQFDYQSTTMMGKTIITVRQDSVITSFVGRGNPTRTARATQNSEWLALVNSLKDVDLTKISTLESPTNKRATDAAPFGTLIVTTKETVFTSSAFDGKNPHEMLMPLMNEMAKIWDTTKE